MPADYKLFPADSEGFARKNDLSYRFYIASRYTQLFHHIIFDSVDPVGNSYLLASLHTFSSLDEITFTRQACSVIFGDDPHRSLQSPLSFSPPVTSFVHKAHSIRTLRLADFAPKEAIPFLKVCSNISTLEIGSFKDTPPDVEAECARASLKIESLILNLNDAFTSSLPSISTDEPWPPLKSVTINVGRSREEELDLDVIRRFRGSLVHLHIECPRIDPNRYTPLSWTPRDSLSRLETLTIISSHEAAYAIFENAQQSMFPVLRRLSLFYNDDWDGSFGDGDEVLATVWPWKSLTPLDYSPPDHDVDIDQELYLQRKASESGIELALSDCPSSTLPSLLLNALQSGVGSRVRANFVLGETDHATGGLLKTIADARGYLAQVEENARLTGDTINLHRVVLSLRNLELDRVAKLD